MSPLDAWAIKHHVSQQALRELADALAYEDTIPTPEGDGKSEAYVTSVVRLEAAAAGVWLTRNNVGALPDRNRRLVRFGLANESKQQNEVIKSADLIGFRPRVIVSADVGTVIAQFISIECKEEGWKFNPNDAHQAAQERWRDFITTSGGEAAFVSGPGHFQPKLIIKLPE